MKHKEKSWKEVFLDKSTGLKLAYWLILTIIYKMLVSWFSATETNAEQTSEQITLVSFGGVGFGLGLFVVLVAWIIARICCSQHSHS
jgi:hypothetical protein